MAAAVSQPSVQIEVEVLHVLPVYSWAWRPVRGNASTTAADGQSVPVSLESLSLSGPCPICRNDITQVCLDCQFQFASCSAPPARHPSQIAAGGDEGGNDAVAGPSLTLGRDSVPSTIQFAAGVPIRKPFAQEEPSSSKDTPSVEMGKAEASKNEPKATEGVAAMDGDGTPSPHQQIEVDLSCSVAFGECGHNYHTHCIENWGRPTCPLCDAEWVVVQTERVAS
jgi:hypothetical protein